MNSAVLQLAAVLLYAAATVLTFAELVVGKRRALGRAYFAATVAGFLAHSAALVTIAVEKGSVPVLNLSEALLTFSWLLVLFLLAVAAFTRIAVLSFFVSPFVLILAGWSFVLRNTPPPVKPGTAGGPFWVHILLSLAGLSGLIVGVAFSWMYGLQEDSLKHKRNRTISRLIPSLETCDRWGRRAITGGFIVYTLGILSAAAWSYHVKRELTVLSAKELGSMVVWAIFAVLLQARLAFGPRGARQVLLGTAGLLAIIATLAGIH